jgi:hypothetical protein
MNRRSVCAGILPQGGLFATQQKSARTDRKRLSEIGLAHLGFFRARPSAQKNFVRGRDEFEIDKDAIT